MQCGSSKETNIEGNCADSCHIRVSYLLAVWDVGWIYFKRNTNFHFWNFILPNWLCFPFLLLHCTLCTCKMCGHHVLSCTWLCSQQKSHRWDERNPHKYLSNTPGGVQASASQPPDPHWKLLLLYSPGGVLCVSASVGWCRTQNNILSNSMQVVFTLPAFFFSISFFTWLCWRSEHCGIFVVRFDFLMARPLWRMQHTLVRRFYLMLVIHFE